LSQTVSVVGASGDVREAVRRGIELQGGLRLKGGERVVIKPNICNARNPYGMVNTDLGVIEAVVELVKERTDDVTVVESDNVSGPADRRAEESGLLRKLGELGVAFFNLSGDEFDVHEVCGVRLHIPKTVLEADYFINMPKMKTEGHVLVTLSMKNLFGVLQQARKNRLHRSLIEVLPYLAKVVRNDLIVVDGVVAMEGNGPLIGTPRDLGVVVSGSSPLPVDVVCTRMMGFDPAEVGYFVRAREMGLGDLDVDGIRVVGEDWRRFAAEFDRPLTLRASIKSFKTIRRVYF
jgi:uncharacterized protein (DUF362 family)